MKKDSPPKEPPILFIVETNKDFDGMEKGSRIYVQREKGKDYDGIWSSMMGSYYVTVPKDICEKLDD